MSVPLPAKISVSPGNSNYQTSHDSLIAAMDNHVHPTSLVNALSNTISNLKRDTDVLTINTTASSTTITVTGSTFNGTANVFTPAVGVTPSPDIGKIIHIDKGDSSGSFGWIKATITSVTSPTTAVISTPVLRTITGAKALFGTNNTTAINSILAAIPKKSGIYFPGGDYYYYTDGGHTISKDYTTILGDGETAQSTIVTSHLTANVFSVTGMYPTFEKIAIIHGAYLLNGNGWAYNIINPPYTSYPELRPTCPTAGAGIHVNMAAGTYGAGAWCGANLKNVALIGMYHGLYFQNGSGMTAERSTFFANVYANARVNNTTDADNGSFKFINGSVGGPADQYMGATLFGILIEGGGGVWVYGNHFWQNVWALCFDMAGAGTQYFTNLSFENNSFEDFNTSSAYDGAEQTTLLSRLGNGAGITIYIPNNKWCHSLVINGNVINSTRSPNIIRITCVDSGRVTNTGVTKASIVGNSSTCSGAFVNINSGKVENSSIAYNSGAGADLVIPSGCTGMMLGPSRVTT
jgi:hypothetical protein